MTGDLEAFPMALQGESVRSAPAGNPA